MRSLSLIFVMVALLGVRLAAAGAAAPLGVLYAGQEAFFDLVYRNEGSASVSIRQVTPACDCITILSHPEVVAPGASVRIACVYRSAKPGNIRTAVEIFGAEPAVPVFSFRVTGFVAEKSWLVRAREVLAGAPDQVLLVDVRPAGDFARSHAPHAINLPAFSLKFQTALRGRKIVLLDGGFAPESLLTEVLAMREQGFKDVAVLAGGLAAWTREGGILEGVDKSTLPLATISAAEFTRANDASPWLCVGVGPAGAAVKQGVPVLQVDDLAGLEKKLAAATWSVTGGAGFCPVLILATDTTLAARIEKHFARDRRLQLYYLTGGRESLATFQASQVAVASHTGQTFVSQPNQSRPVVSGRCGSCGR